MWTQERHPMNVCSSTAPDPSTSRVHHRPSALAATDAMCFLDDLEGGNDLNPAESNAKMASGRPSPDMAPAHESIRLPPILGEDAGEFTPEPR